MLTDFITHEERNMSIRSEIASDAVSDLRVKRDKLIADLRARLGVFANEVDALARDAATVSLDLAELAHASAVIADAVDDLIHDLRVDLENIERGDA